jgi:hypothetical protein
MSYTYFFYGTYMESEDNSSYQMGAAYWFVLLCCFLISLMAIVR